MKTCQRCCEWLHCASQYSQSAIANRKELLRKLDSTKKSFKWYQLYGNSRQAEWRTCWLYPFYLNRHLCTHALLSQLEVTSALMTAVLLVIVYLFCFPTPFCLQLSVTHLVGNLSVSCSKIIPCNCYRETHLNGCNSKSHVLILIS
jgi:hypothetical protein